MKQSPSAKHPQMTLIAAISTNGLIGRENVLPWRIPNDLKFFKQTTLDHVILMGLNTWNSFGSRCLPRRHHVVVTSNPAKIITTPGDPVTIASTLELGIHSARIAARAQGQDEFFVIGGASIYEQTIGLADRLILTKVHWTFEHQSGDVYFPQIGPEWELKSSGPTEETPEGLRYTLGMVYERADL